MPIDIVMFKRAKNVSAEDDVKQVGQDILMESAPDYVGIAFTP